ncbi:unnamed protein product, partial [Brugia timori]|uniref:WH2 domain-containing protein n=1 Tax=Brugia timori TaxID=42155 RepID=A0A0R3QDZ3_9BILA
MIEKNIANTDSNAINAITSTDNDNNITELYVESIVENQENNSKNVTVYINDIETYDNLNTFTVSSCAVNEKQSVLKRDNLKLNLKCSRKMSNDEKHQSIPHSLKSNCKKINNQNSIKSFLMLPKHKKLTSVSSSDSIETVSSVSPFKPTPIQSQYANLKNKESTCDAIISQKTEQMTSSLYENQQDAITVNSMKTDANSSEKKLIDFKDQIEIQQALKQLDDVLDEQIAIETSLTSSNPEKCNVEIFEEKNETTKLKDKKSVKQLVEILDSKQLQFKMRNMPSKLHSTIINQDSDFTSDNEGNTKAKASLCISDPEITSKPSLIGVNIFGLNDGKSIAEIIAEKRNYENYSLHKRPPASPKPVLKKSLPTPKPSTSDEREQKWLLPSSSNQVVTHSSDISLADNRKENIIITVDKNSK